MWFPPSAAAGGQGGALLGRATDRLVSGLIYLSSWELISVVAWARNHLPANRSLEFRLEILIRI
jgi:hypothetical protein